MGWKRWVEGRWDGYFTWADPLVDRFLDHIVQWVSGYAVLDNINFYITA
jgi:hypothetical protein